MACTQGRWNKDKVILLSGGFILLLAMAAIRLIFVARDLPYYFIDENEIVEPALAYLCGDLDPHWYKYGPLFSYLLSIIYKAWQWVSAIALGWTPEDFYYAAFFAPTPFYVLARAFHEAIILAIVGVSYCFAKRFYDRPTALAVLILASAPLLNMTTAPRFTARLDTLQGFFCLLSIFMAAHLSKDHRSLGIYAGAGCLAGLSIATKPLPGLVLLPTLFLAHILAVWPETATRNRRRSLGLVLHPGILVGAGVLVLTHCIVHPYSVIKFSVFYQEQYNVLFSSAAQGGKYLGYDFNWLILLWGWPLTIASAIALLMAWRWSDPPSRLLWTYVITFCCVFLAFKTRMYWYNAVFPALLLLIARLLALLAHASVKVIRVPPSVAAAFLAAGLVMGPWIEAGSIAWSSWPLEASIEKRTDRAAQHWIERCIPAHSSILLVGWYSINLPRIVADTAKTQALWGEHFMYKRSENKPWIKVFTRSYKLFQKTGRQSYRVANIRRNYNDSHADERLNTVFRESLAAVVLKNGFKYLVTASPEGFHGIWEQNENVRLLSIFNRESGHVGAEVKVFEISAQ